MNMAGKYMSNTKKSYDRNRFDQYIERKNQNMSNLTEIAKVNKMKHNTMIPEINHTSNKMLSLDTNQTL
jgi:hypothetical protein